MPVICCIIIKASGSPEIVSFGLLGYVYSIRVKPEMYVRCLIFFFVLQIFLNYSESLFGEENHKIASKVVFNDTEKTVWEMILEPGEEFAFHTHIHDYLFYVIEGSTIEALDSNGDLTATIIANAGEVLSFKVDGEFLVSQQVTIPRSHGVRNVGTSR